MTHSEIDSGLEELRRIRFVDFQSSFALCENLLTAAKQLEYHSPLAQLYLYHADLLVLFGRHDEATKSYELAYQAAESAADQKMIGRITAGKASITVYRFDLPASKELLERAISIAISCDDTIGQGMGLSALAHVYYLWGLPALATGYAYDSYTLLKDTSFCTYPLFRLGSLLSIAGDNESAKQFYLEGIAATDTYNIPTAKPTFLGELGIVYTRLGDLKAARTQYEAAVKAADALCSKETAANILLLLGRNDYEQGNYDAAEKTLLLAIERSIGLRKRLTLWAHQYLAIIAHLRGEHANAISKLDELLDSTEEGYEQAFLESAYRVYIDCFTELADWKQVAHYEKKLREYKDTIDSSQFKSNLTTVQSFIATEREKHEKEIEKMKREQLERELTNTTLQLLAQTEQLAEFREGILAVIRKAPPTEAIAKELREKLKVLPCKSIDWDKFEAQFTAAHPEFRLRLTEAYPGLTKMEIRICTLLRMNLKSQDISQLTCLSERNIENHRYRIRKKMELLKEQDLAQELMKL
jgi:tetratricopeptide (TPR) repeat protein